MFANLRPPFWAEGNKLLRRAEHGINLEATFTSKELAEKVADLLNEDPARQSQTDKLQQERDRYYRGEQEVYCNCIAAHKQHPLREWKCPEYVAELETLLQQCGLRRCDRCYQFLPTERVGQLYFCADCR